MTWAPRIVAAPRASCRDIPPVKALDLLADARMYCHRGHRYLSIRTFDLAVRDWEKAAELTRGKPDVVPPDGIPNAQGIPTSTLQSNIRYHLALGYYLQGAFAKALPFYQQDGRIAVNPDLVVASSRSHRSFCPLER